MRFDFSFLEYFFFFFAEWNLLCIRLLKYPAPDRKGHTFTCVHFQVLVSIKVLVNETNLHCLHFC